MDQKMTRTLPTFRLENRPLSRGRCHDYQCQSCVETGVRRGETGNITVTPSTGPGYLQPSPLVSPIGEARQNRGDPAANTRRTSASSTSYSRASRDIESMLYSTAPTAASKVSPRRCWSAKWVSYMALQATSRWSVSRLDASINDATSSTDVTICVQGAQSISLANGSGTWRSRASYTGTGMQPALSTSKKRCVAGSRPAGANPYEVFIRPQ